MSGRASTRVVLYGISAFMDMVAGTLLFVVPVMAARMGSSYSLSAGMGVAWGVGAGLMTVFIGRYVTQRNAARLCILACVVQALLQLGMIAYARTPGTMLGAMFLIGLTHTLFYVPYYVFFKAVDSAGNLPLAMSVGIYTFAWSLGMAAGPLWSGFLLRESLGALQGWQLCFIFTVFSLLLVGAGIGWVYARNAAAVRDSVPAENEFHDFSRLSWLAALCGSFAFSLVRGLFPAGAVSIGVSEEIQGGVIFCMGLFQALAAVVLIRLLYWMYRPGMLAGAGAAGFTGMALFLAAFWFLEGGARVAAFFAGAILFGMYSGTFYFYTAYHCLVHPVRAGFNIAVCEGMHAVANIVGLLAGGMLSDLYGVRFPYLAAAVIICFFTAVQIYQHCKHPPLVAAEG